MNEMLFSGEYEGIAEIASSHSPQDIFSASLLPFRGKDIGGADAVEHDEYAKDNRTYFAHSAFQMSNEAVKARPDKASAWFIRAWGAFYFDAKYLMGYQPEIAEPFLKVPGRNAIILASLEQAAALRDPRREFYVNCLNWWRTNGATAQPPTGVPPR